MLWKGFQRPNRLEVEEEKGNYGRFTAQPLERGWGTTVGNALRRVLLSSIEGAAITAVKIEGVEHEFTAVMAAPSIEERRTRRSAFPTVVPQPRSSGWAVYRP